MSDKDITTVLRAEAKHIRECWDDIPMGIPHVEYLNDMKACEMLARAASTIDTLYGEVRDLKQRNVRLLSQIQEMEAREQ